MGSHKLYRSLKSDEIRLLVLLPAAFGESIECELIHSATFSNCYAALSYEWGLPTSDPDQKKHIILDGQELPVRDNLWHALQHLRSPSDEFTLWIDAICINQEDYLERNHQVGLMKEIYSKATLVHVWLGKGTPQTCHAFDLLKKFWDTSGCMTHEGLERLARIAKMRKQVCPYGDENYEIEELMLQPMVQMDFASSLENNTEMSRRMAVPFYSGHENWIALAYVTDNGYWRRIWIVQEYLLARKTRIHCGLNWIDGMVFDGALTHVVNHIVETLPDIHPITRESVQSISNSAGLRFSNCRSYPKQRTFLELLDICKDSEACQPRDKLYALLGFASDAPGNQEEYAMLIDYRSTDTAVKSTFAKVFEVKQEMVPLLDYMMRDAKLEAFAYNSSFETPIRITSVKEVQLRTNCLNWDYLIIPENWAIEVPSKPSYTRITSYNGGCWLILQCGHCGTTDSEGGALAHQTRSLNFTYKCLHCNQSNSFCIKAEDCCCESCNCTRRRDKVAKSLNQWNKSIDEERWNHSIITSMNIK